jgi:hypothetical protein
MDRFSFTQGAGLIVLMLGLGLVFVNLLVGFNDANPSPTNIGGNIRKVLTGK